MISPETYYSLNLEEKTPAQIMTAIRGLKREISRLKRVLEHPDYACTICPSVDVRLSCMQDYLEKAKQALTEAGGSYTPTKDERRIAEFNEHLETVADVRFRIGGYLTEKEDKTVVVSGDDLLLKSEFFPEAEKNVEVVYQGVKKDFITSLQRLNLGG